MATRRWAALALVMGGVVIWPRGRSWRGRARVALWSGGRGGALRKSRRARRGIWGIIAERARLW